MDVNEATQQLNNWLAHPNELGKRPAKIIFTKRFEDVDEIECLIFKYKKTLLGKWYLGIVSESGVFSEMKEYHSEREVEDATEILTMLKEYWKNVARQFSEK